MKFAIETKGNIADLIRRCGYHLAKSRGDELSFARRLGSSQYPRFHLYIIESADKYSLNLHLDQKKPSYPGAYAHNAEYGGKIITKEADRIKEIINKIF